MTIPRMRTITETIAEIKAIDPMTAVTPNCIYGEEIFSRFR